MTAKTSKSQTAGTAEPPTAKTPTAKTLIAKNLTVKNLTEGQRAYEAKRAAKAGMSLDRWLESKQRHLEAEARAREKAAEPPKVKKDTFFTRLLERAHKPL